MLNFNNRNTTTMHYFNQDDFKYGAAFGLIGGVFKLINNPNIMLDIPIHYWQGLFWVCFTALVSGIIGGFAGKLGGKIWGIVHEYTLKIIRKKKK